MGRCKGREAHELVTLEDFGGFCLFFLLEFAEIAAGMLKTSFPVDDGKE